MNIAQLLPQAVREQLPPLVTTSEQENPMIQAKFFYPDFSWTWYAIEFDGEDIFYGLVDGDFTEFGTFSLKELMSTRGTLGFEIERDLSFKPLPLTELQANI